MNFNGGQAMNSAFVVTGFCALAAPTGLFSTGARK
jgi:hypothetical protein